MCGEAQGCTHVCMKRKRCVCMREEAWGRAARWGVSSSLHPHPPYAQIWKARAPHVLPRSTFSSREPVPLQPPCPRAPSCSDWGHTQPWLGSSPSPAQLPPSVTMGASISAPVQGLAGSCRRCSPGCPAATCTCARTWPPLPDRPPPAPSSPLHAGTVPACTGKPAISRCFLLKEAIWVFRHKMRKIWVSPHLSMVNRKPGTVLMRREAEGDGLI